MSEDATEAQQGAKGEVADAIERLEINTDMLHVNCKYEQLVSDVRAVLASHSGMNDDMHALEERLSETRAVLADMVEAGDLFREAIELAIEDNPKRDGPIWETPSAMAIDSSYLKRLGGALTSAQALMAGEGGK